MYEINLYLTPLLPSVRSFIYLSVHSNIQVLILLSTSRRPLNITVDCSVKRK